MIRARLARTVPVLLAAFALCAAAAPVHASHGKHDDKRECRDRGYAGSISVGRDGFVVGIGLGNAFCKPAPAREWIEGRWVERVERVWIEGREERVWIPAEYRTVRDHCGRTTQVLARPGHWRVECVPGRYETVVRREWEPGHWETRWRHY